MKKIIYIVCLFAYISQSKAQLLNAKFEDWTFVKVFSGSNDTLWSPKNWTVYNNCADDDYYGNKLTKPFGIEGKFGIGLSTLVCGISGYAKPTYLVYGNHNQKSTNNSKSWGVPYSSKLHSIGGKFSFTNERFISDSGYAQVILTKYNIKKFESDTIGFGNISFPVSLNKNILVFRHFPWVS